MIYAQPMEMNDPEILARTGEFHLSHMPIDAVYAITDEARAVGKALGVRVDLAGYMTRPKGNSPVAESKPGPSGGRSCAGHPALPVPLSEAIPVYAIRRKVPGIAVLLHAGKHWRSDGRTLWDGL